MTPQERDEEGSRGGRQKAEKALGAVRQARGGLGPWRAMEEEAEEAMVKWT